MIGKTNALFLFDEPGGEIVYNFLFTGARQTFTFEPGTYILECWGSQGGYRSKSSSSGSPYSGKGGYSIGTININSLTTGYIYVGGSGISTNSSARCGFNGGGQAGYSSIKGGGASDIRIGTDSLYARVIVAGGGGSCGASKKQGGAGGGKNGQASTSGGGTGGGGGTQTSGGYGYSSYSVTTKGSWGNGGRGYSHHRGCGGGGGGGWYGGGGTYPDNRADDDKGGGGGSGWIYTETTYNNWKTNSIEGRSGNWLLSSNYYLNDAATIDGTSTFLSPNGANETGHSGDGYVRITRKIVKQCKLQVIGIFGGQSILISRTDYTQGTTIDISELPSKFENYIVKDKLWYSDSSCTNLISEDFILNQNKRIYCKLIKTSEFNFEYTGNVQSISLSAGKYILECWGAQGGISGHSATNFGKGGYARGTLDISNRTNLFIYVGGKGENGLKDATKTPLGGFNGGGSGGQGKNDNAGGGGASDIRINTDSLYSRVIVAGGAGGNGCDKYIGGSGGGSSGINGYGSTAFGDGGSGGTQRSGGISSTTYATSGSFGVGGGANSTSNEWGCGGGGGGWYGGASGQSQSGGGGSGGGGSGWVYTEDTYNNWATNSTEGKSGQWLLNSNYYLTSTELMSGTQTFNAPNGNTETGHSGNGYVRITRILE